MKTLLYLGAGMDCQPIVHCDFDRYIYVDKRPMHNLNDALLDDFISKIKSLGFKVKLTSISYTQPFYIKCYNDQKYIKYYFNTSIPTSSMLVFENIDAVYVNIEEDMELITTMLKAHMKDNCQIMHTSNLQHHQ